MLEFDPSKKHPLFHKWCSKWMRQRDAIEGEDRVKDSAVAEKFSPEHIITTYEGYKKRASFMNATGRTRDGLVGAIMRKDADIQWPKAQSELLETSGYELESFEELMMEALDESIGIGRFGQLVDMPQDADEDSMPFVSTYIAECITDWELGLVKGRRRNVRINLMEKPKRKSSREDRMLERYRVLRLGEPEPVTADEQAMFDEMGRDAFLEAHGLVAGDFDDGPVYFQELWTEIDGSNVQSGASKFVREQVIVPRAAGGVLWREIPFVFFNPTHTKAKPEKPTLLDLTVVNFSHYRNSADYEHGLHFTALPQPWLAGFKFDGQIYIGSGVAWVTENADANAGFLEFTGEGLGAIKEAMERKEKQMAALGARLLEEQQPSGSAEAAETVRLRQSGEGSALARLARAVSAGLTNTLEFLAAFRGISAKVGVSLNEDFGVEGLAPDMLKALMEQVQGGMMSWDTYVYNVRRGELYPDGWTDTAEAAAILKGPPKGSVASMMAPDMESDDDDDEVDEDEDDEAESEGETSSS
jgi:hypothetical protein